MAIISGSGGGGGCFRKGTKVLQEAGNSTSIELLSIGDLVLSYDELGNIHVSKITKVHVHKEPEPLIRITYWNGFVELTPNHWVLNQYGAFAAAGTLTTEDAFIDGLGHLRPIIKIEQIEAEEVWNLTVEPNHTFIASGIRVHNGGYRQIYPVAGSGGGSSKGGGGGHTPTESADSLHSKQYARLIDLVSEGEVVGLVNGLKSIYLDDTPIQASDGTNNFSGVEMVERKGTQNQTYIPGFSNVESEVSVSTKVTYEAPVVRSISGSNIDAVRITIGIPQLTYQNPSNGDLSGTSVDIRIEVDTNGGGYVLATEDTISGKTTSRYQRSYRIELPKPLATNEWDIKVTRVTANSTQSNLRNDIYWESYTRVADSKLSYPNSALIALSVDSEQFKSIPTRGYHIKGLKVQIPNNYNPLTRKYTGTWNGGFVTDWTDNPAWCFYDMITNSRYGLGDFINVSQVDVWSLYTIAQYCDAVVPFGADMVYTGINDGYGGKEPRFTCNLYLQTQEEAYKVLNSMASIFRGMIYWSTGTIVATQDAPTSPTAIFTAANVIDGVFNYQGSSAKSRHTVVLVSWNDPADRYRQKIEYVEDTIGIERYGIIQSDLVAVGCTSRGQANRIGRWLLYTERLESETITFRTGLDGILVNPGEVIKTSDPLRAGQRMGGRVEGPESTTDISIDMSVTLLVNQSYTLWCMLPDGSTEYRTVVSPPSITNVISVSTPFTVAPQVGAIWVLSASNLVPETWRVVSVSEVDGTQAEVTALAYREEKYDAVENDLVLEPLPTTSITTASPGPVSDVNIMESLYLVGLGVVGVKASISWTPGAYASYYVVRYRRQNENWVELTTSSTSIDVGPLVEDHYEFTITSYNILGRSSTVVSTNAEIVGKLVPPADVENFQIRVYNNQANLTWNATTDLDVIVNGSLKIKFSSDPTPTWINATDLSILPSTATSSFEPLKAGTYLAKWVDSSGVQSTNATLVTIPQTNITNVNFILNLVKHPTFAGTYTDVVLDSAVGGLKLGSSAMFDTLGLIDDVGFIDSAGGIASYGTYNFDTYLDLGYVYTSRLEVIKIGYAYDANDFIDSRVDFIDSWLSVDGDLIDDVRTEIMVRTTDDDPSGTPTWSNWVSFHIGDWTSRAFEFRVDFINNSLTHNVVLQELIISVDMPDRVDLDNDVISGASTYSVVYSTPFKGNPSVSITSQNMATGDYYELSNKDVTGFDITFKNSGGTAVSRTFDWQARGY